MNFGEIEFQGVDEIHLAKERNQLFILVNKEIKFGFHKQA
jgi:hypothetical protein